MNARYVEPIVRSSPDRWDALWLILTGVALCLFAWVVIGVASRAGDVFWGWLDERAAIRAQEVSATASFAASLSTHEDIAAVEAAIARGEMVTKLTTAKPKRQRLVAHARRYGGAK